MTEENKSFYDEGEASSVKEEALNGESVSAPEVKASETEATGEVAAAEAETEEVTAEETAPAYEETAPAYEAVSQTAVLEPSDNGKRHGRKKVKRNGAALIAAILCTAICLTSLGFSISLAVQNNGANFTFPTFYTPEYQFTAQTDINDMVKLDVPTVIERNLDSVVIIKTTITTAYQTGMGLASGFIFTADGYIVTNAHVVADATSASVTLHDGTEYTAEVVGYDAANEVAVLKIDAKDLKPVSIGNSDVLVAGEQVVAIGNPYSAELAFTATDGIISAVRREYHFAELGVILDVIQHSAPINEGNSGGPLFNMYGQVIGMNSIKIGEGFENVGFAIEINTLLPLIEDIINNGSVQRPSVGISCATNTTIGGVDVATVNPGSAAEKAGLVPGDIITKFNGIRVKSYEELVNLIAKCDVGQECTLTILRDVESVELKIILDGALG